MFSCKNEDEEIVKGCNAGVVMENMLLEAADLGLVPFICLA